MSKAPGPGTFAAVLAAKSEAELLRVHAALESAGFATTLICEPDEPWCGQAMAIGLPPQPREPLRPILKKLQTAK